MEGVTVDVRRWLLSAKNHHRSSWLALAGVVLAGGAPAGLWAVWTVLEHLPAQELRSITLWFVGLTSAAVLGGFGAVAGWLMDALVDAREQLAQEALEDHLTGLSNRRAMQHALTAELRRHERTREPVALIMLDVDHFKRVNDRLGHPAGAMPLLARHRPPGRRGPRCNRCRAAAARHAHRAAPGSGRTTRGRTDKSRRPGQGAGRKRGLNSWAGGRQSVCHRGAAACTQVKSGLGPGANAQVCDTVCRFRRQPAVVRAAAHGTNHE